MAMFYEEIAAAAASRGLFAVVASTNDDPDAERLAVESLVRRRVDGLLDRTDRPTAVFAINDNTAIGVMAVAHALDLRVPDDLSLVGYNDIPVVSRLPVPLTTVRVPFPQIAATALELLREAGDDGPPRTLVAAPTLIPRRSAVAYVP